MSANRKLVFKTVSSLLGLLGLVSVIASTVGEGPDDTHWGFGSAAHASADDTHWGTPSDDTHW